MRDFDSSHEDKSLIYYFLGGSFFLLKYIYVNLSLSQMFNICFNIQPIQSFFSPLIHITQKELARFLETLFYLPRNRVMGNLTAM